MTAIRPTPALFCATALLVASAATAMPADSWRGKPRVRVGKSVAAYGWQAVDGRLHVRVTAPYRSNGTHHVSGALCATDGGTVGSLQRILLEPRDRVAMDGRCARFAFETNGHIDGLSLRPKSKRMSLSVRVDDRKLAPAQIHIGPKGTPPRSNPAVYQK